MKKSILALTLITFLSVSGMFTVSAQEQPKPQKDTVNMDTDAKPQFYYAVEDEDSTPGVQGKFASGTIAIVVGAVILLGGAAYLFLRKKK